VKDIEIFKKVEAHLLAQKVKSVDADGDCMYRGNNGMMCAVGCLIKDEFYNTAMERVAVTAAFVHSVLTKSIGDYNENTENMLSQLQTVHDDKKPEFWQHHLNAFEFTPEGDYVLYSYKGKATK
jgi:hypothetical protein